MTPPGKRYPREVVRGRGKLSKVPSRPKLSASFQVVMPLGPSEGLRIWTGSLCIPLALRRPVDYRACCGAPRGVYVVKCGPLPDPSPRLRGFLHRWRSVMPVPRIRDHAHRSILRSIYRPSPPLRSLPDLRIPYPRPTHRRGLVPPQGACPRATPSPPLDPSTDRRPPPSPPAQCLASSLTGPAKKINTPAIPFRDCATLQTPQLTEQVLADLDPEVC